MTEEALELYALLRLEEAKAATVEAHLIDCKECRNALERIEHWIAMLRQALRQDEINRIETELDAKNREGKVIIFRRPPPIP